MNIIISYRNSPLKDLLNKTGGFKVSVKKDQLCSFLLDMKINGFNEVLYYDWMDERTDWSSLTLKDVAKIMLAVRES